MRLLVIEDDSDLRRLIAGVSRGRDSNPRPSGDEINPRDRIESGSFFALFLQFSHLWLILGREPCRMIISGRRRQNLVAVATAVALCSLAFVTACGGGSGDSAPAGGALGTGQDQLSRKNFGAPATGANRFLPLKPGTQWTREGQVDVGHRTLPHRVVTTVTDGTKEVDGVRTVVLLDQDFNGGEISEQALDYLAEDKKGNVWYLGSYTESYEGGQFVNVSDSWLAGIKGAKAGITMLADPHVGSPPYSEADVPGVDATTFEVAKTGESQCVPFKCYNDVLVVDEDGSEYKYYAPGVGQIKTEPRESGGKNEIEELVNLTQLSPRGLAEVGAEVLTLDQNAKSQAPDVFGNAPAAKRTP